MFKNLSLSSSIFTSKNTQYKRYQSSNPKQFSSSNNIFLAEKSFNAKYKCLLHQKNYSLFCSTCNKDICILCETNHRNHNIYNSKDFKPSSKEIHTLKKTIEKYLHDYNLLINELNFWKKVLDKKISYFTQNIQSFNSNENIKFIDEFNPNYTCFYEAIKFRKIYSCIIPENSNEIEINNKVINEYGKNHRGEYYKPFYNSQDFLLSENILKELISSNDDINNMSKFISISSMIINYIIELNKKCQTFFKNDEINNSRNDKEYEINTYSGKKNSKYMSEDNMNNNDNKIIEKFIDFKEYYNQNPNKPMTLSSITPKSKYIRSILKNKKEQNCSLKTSYSSNTLFKSPNINFSDSNAIYSKKTNTPKIFDNLSKAIERENPFKKNGIVDLVLNSAQTIKGKRYLNKSYSLGDDNKLHNPLQTLNLSNLKNSSVTKNNKNNIINNTSEKNFQKFIYNLKTNNYLYGVNQKEKKTKTYIHKKLSKINIKNINRKKENNNSFNSNYTNINNKKNENEFSTYDDKYNTLSYQKDIIKNGNNVIKSSLFKMLKYSSDEAKKKTEEKKIHNYLIKGRLPKIIRAKYDEKIIIDGEQPLYIGLDLGDSDCKLSVINQFNNEIKLVCFKKSVYKIPSVIYFDENKNDVKIGTDAENEGNSKPTQIVFDLLKFIGIKYDEIIGKKDLWPFKIYQNAYTKRPYIKSNYDNQKGKKFSFEDILSMFIQKLFSEFFKKITLKNENNKNIKLYIQLSLPNYLNYFQKKVIEKIFDNNIFSNNKTYNGYNVFLQKIKLENSTNIMCLYNGLENMNNSDKNILSVFIDRCSINLSIINKKRMLYEVKGVESAAFGEEDFTDNFMCYCLRNLDERLNNIFLNSPILLYELRKAINLAKKNFNIIPKTKVEINVQKEEKKNNNDDTDYEKIISLLLKKTDYEKSCDEFFKKIILLIKQILINSRVSEMDIDDIIIIGQTASATIIKTILYDIFKNNKKINKISLLSNSTLIDRDIDNDCLISIGCSLQLMNNYRLLTLNYTFTDISPFSFGIENLDGLMDVVIPKGKKFPCKSKKLIKINNKNQNICINILEGEHICSDNNKIIASAVIDRAEFKEIDRMDYVEVIVQLEIDCDYNLKCYIIEPKSNNKFECLININVVKK